MEERKTVVEYVKPQEKPSNTAGIVGAILGSAGLGTAALVGIGNAMGNTVTRYFGNGGNAPISIAPTANLSGVANAIASTINHSHHNNDYVTEKEMKLVREIMSEKSELAQLKAEKYADNKVQEAVDKVTARYDVISNKVCNLETHAAVTATAFEDYKQFANRLFVHQPKAKMTDCIVTTTSGCCCCSGTPSAPAI